MGRDGKKIAGKEKFHGKEKQGMLQAKKDNENQSVTCFELPFIKLLGFSFVLSSSESESVSDT